MLSHNHADVAHRRMPLHAVLQPPEPALEWIGAVEDEEHIIVLGGSGPDLTCALLRAGAAHVTHLMSPERPEAGSASLMVVPRVPSLDWLATALPSIRRALVLNGRLIIRGGTQFNFPIEARRMLTLHGFAAIRARQTDQGHVLYAELRASGIRRAA